MKRRIKEFSPEMSEWILSCYMGHYKACENWEHGEAVEVWFEDGVLCIRYEDGSWYHYNRTENGLEWW